MTQSTDVILLPFLHAEDQQESDECLARLIAEHATPLIRNVIKGKLHLLGPEHPDRQEADELQSEVLVQLLARLRAFRASADDNSIRDFRGYIAVTTYNVCNLYLRKKYPARWRLKNRLRYALTHWDDFAVWKDDEGEWLCGLAAWHAGGKNSAAGAERLRQLKDDDGARERAGLGAAGVFKAELKRLLQAVFTYAGAPVLLEDLLSLVAELQGVRDGNKHVTIGDLEDSRGHEREISASPGFTNELEWRSYLRRLWTEISKLPPLQRTALLLNLRDEQEGVIALLPVAGIASLRQIAQAVGMPDEKLAALWNDLPLEDAAIAGLLAVTRQQVINLRKAARARLRRRMKLLDDVAVIQMAPKVISRDDHLS